MSKTMLGFSDRSLGQIFTTFTYTAHQLQPGLIVRIPLNNDFSDAYGLSIGLSLGYRFGGSSEDVPLDEF